MNKFFLQLIIFVSGAIFLALGLLEIGILNPFYGMSLFLWTSIVAFELVALSVGYMVGGRMADKDSSMHKIYSFIGISGIWMLLTAWLSYQLLNIVRTINGHISLIIAALLLFFIPQMFLAIIIPMTITLKATSFEQVGRVSGNVFTLMAIGGIISLFVTGYILMPFVGIINSIIIYGYLLVVIALIGFIRERKSKMMQALLIIILLTGVFSIWYLPAHPFGTIEGLIKSETVDTSEIQIIEVENGKQLMINNRLKALIDTVEWKSHLRYVAVMDLPMHFLMPPGKMLLFGLGGGSIAKNYARHGWKVDVVEPNEKMIDFAHNYLGLAPIDARIFTSDGRRFMGEHTDKYDIILVDALSGSSFPYQLMTKEFFDIATDHLNDGGIFSISVESIGWKDDIVLSLSATLKQVFRQVLVLPIAEPPDQFGSIVLFATYIPREDFVWDLTRNYDYSPFWRYGPDYQKVHAWDNRFIADDSNARIITDDKNLLMLIADRLNFAARKQTTDYLP